MQRDVPTVQLFQLQLLTTIGVENTEAERTETAPLEVEQKLGEVMLFEPVIIQNYLTTSSIVTTRRSQPSSTARLSSQHQWRDAALLRPKQPDGVCASASDGCCVPRV